MTSVIVPIRPGTVLMGRHLSSSFTSAWSGLCHQHWERALPVACDQAHWTEPNKFGFGLVSIDPKSQVWTVHCSWCSKSHIWGLKYFIECRVLAEFYSSFFFFILRVRRQDADVTIYKSEVVFFYCLLFMHVWVCYLAKLYKKKQNEYLKKYYPLLFGFIMKEICMPTLVLG